MAILYNENKIAFNFNEGFLLDIKSATSAEKVFFSSRIHERKVLLCFGRESESGVGRRVGWGEAGFKHVARQRLRRPTRAPIQYKDGILPVKEIPLCGDKTILRPSYLHNGISYTGKMSSLYWIEAQAVLVDVSHDMETLSV